jgi:hypothetical protein
VPVVWTWTWTRTGQGGHRVVSAQKARRLLDGKRHVSDDAARNARWAAAHEAVLHLADREIPSLRPDARASRHHRPQSILFRCIPLQTPWAAHPLAPVFGPRLWPPSLVPVFGPRRNATGTDHLNKSFPYNKSSENSCVMGKKRSSSSSTSSTRNRKTSPSPRS